MICPLTAFMLESFFFQAICTYTKGMHILGIFIVFIFLRVFFFIFAYTHMLCPTYSSYSLQTTIFLYYRIFVHLRKLDILSYTKGGYIIRIFILNFHKIQLTCNDIIHLCHEYQFDDKICSLQKQLQILYLAKDLFF